jgi:hypothetical protein
MAAPRTRRRRRLTWLVVSLLVVAAIVAYTRLTADDDQWEALRGPFPFGDGRCAVALSPDRAVERTVCVVGGSMSCFDGRRRLAPARADCTQAREALVEDGLLPGGQRARS